MGASFADTAFLDEVHNYMGERVSLVKSLCRLSDASAWQVGLVSVGSDTRTHMVAQKRSCVLKGRRCPACPWEVGKPTSESLIRSFPIPTRFHLPLRPSLRWVACQCLSLREAWQAFVSPALALGTGVCAYSLRM